VHVIRDLPEPRFFLLQRVVRQIGRNLSRSVGYRACHTTEPALLLSRGIRRGSLKDHRFLFCFKLVVIRFQKNSQSSTVLKSGVARASFQEFFECRPSIFDENGVEIPSGLPFDFTL